jgi:DnaK suppressor protein
MEYYIGERFLPSDCRSLQKPLFIAGGEDLDQDEVKRSLEQRLERLIARLATIDSEIRSPGSKDWEERGIESENEEVLESLSVSGRDEISAIQQALDRIEKGTYESCSKCGQQISPQRLEALPFTTVCVSCAS